MSQSDSKLSIHDSAVLQYKQLGTPIEVSEAFLDLLVPDAGELTLIYGRIGQGKTTLTVTQMFEDLMRGQVVYSSFRINWDGFDQRQSIVHVIVGLLFPFYKTYKKFPKENWHYLDCYRDDIWDVLYELNDCKIYFDDVIVKLFDSYEKTDFTKKKRQWAFETRHFDRSIILVTQRPNQVQIALRSQVNRFYKCEKLLSWPFLLFKRTEYQDMVTETVDETKPVSVRHVIPKKAILNAFKSKYLRNGAKSSQQYFVDLYSMSYLDKLIALKLVIMSKLPKLKFGRFLKKGSAAPPPEVFAPSEVYDKIRSIRNVHVVGGKIENTTLKNSSVGSIRTTVGGEVAYDTTDQPPF